MKKLLLFMLSIGLLSNLSVLAVNMPEAPITPKKTVATSKANNVANKYNNTYKPKTTDPQLQELCVQIGMLDYLKKYDEALQLTNTSLTKYPNSADLYLNRGIIYDHKENHTAALSDFTKVISLDKNNTDAYFWSGSEKMDLNNNQGALQDFNKCLEISPNNSSCYAMRGMVLLELGDFKGSASDLDKSNELLDKEMNDFDKDF